MFYDKSVQIIGFSNGSTNQYGMYSKDTETVIDTIDCDVQPITRELSNKEYGLDEDVDYTIFCDSNDSLRTGVIVKYDNVNYKIKQIIKWDDYWILIVGDTNDVWE